MCVHVRASLCVCVRVCVCIPLTYILCVFGCRKREATADGSANPTAADAFAVDLTDSRFSALLSRDGRFGIDTTSNEFKSKDTKEMKRLLAAQRSSAAATGMNTHKKKQQQQQQPQAKAAEEEEYKLLGKHSKHASMGGAAANSHHNGSNNSADNVDNDGDLHNQLAERLKKKFKK
jgi:hypothetical protein